MVEAIGAGCVGERGRDVQGCVTERDGRQANDGEAAGCGAWWSNDGGKRGRRRRAMVVGIAKNDHNGWAACVEPRRTMANRESGDAAR